MQTLSTVSTDLSNVFNGKTLDLVNDLNTPFSIGGTTFSINRYYSSASNKPIENANGSLLTWSSSDNFGAQLALSPVGSFVRFNDNNTISKWHQLEPKVNALNTETNIFDFLTTSYPPGTYCGSASKLTNGSTSTLTNLLSIGTSAIVKIEKLDDWNISITITSQSNYFCWATCNKNSTSLTFAKIDARNSAPVASQITVTKATS